jgi:isorenieratene synthase
MLMMFHLYFLGTAEGLLFDVCDEPFSDAIWRPFGRLLAALDVDVRTGSAVGSVDELLEGADGAVLALDVAALRSVVGASALGGASEQWQEDIDALRPAPPFAVWRVWLDRDVAQDRAPFVGTAGLGILDNISCVHRYQGESRRWALRTGGSVLELHGYALEGEVDARGVRDELAARLRALYPETAAAAIVDERLLLRSDCPGFPPGSSARRPTVETPDPRVMVAGDLVRLPFPTALMERAATSGILAANRLLRRFGVTGDEVWSIPARGVLAGLSSTH